MPLWITLRTQKNSGMVDLVAKAEGSVEQLAQEAGLTHEISYHDVFDHCENNADATRILDTSLSQANIPRTEAELPMRGSEDFGRFGTRSKAAMFLLGSGEETASLHNPDFDFPDELIPLGAAVFANALKQLCYADTGTQTPS